MKKNEKQKKRKLIIISIVAVAIFITSIFAISLCIYYNIGPMNEISCIFFNVQNPTYNEMMRFVEADITKYNEYTSEYRCGHFSTDMILNARDQGIQAGFVRIIGVENNHAIVVFKTTDMGIFYVEPQSNYIFHQTEMDYYMSIGTYRAKGKTTYFNVPMIRYDIYWMYGFADITFLDWN